MIKINLNRTRVGQSGGQDQSAASAATSAPLETLNPSNARENIIKVIVMFVGVIGIMVYEKQLQNQAALELSIVQAQLSELRGQLDQKNAELAKLKDIEPQSQMLNDKLKILREYSRLRLVQLQSLDFVQSVIPERVWLRSIHFEKGHYQILGDAVETPDLTDFVQKLEGSAYFQDVIVIQDRERPMQAGRIREYELTARSGRSQ